MDKDKTHNERVKEIQEKLRKRAKDLLSSPSLDEPSTLGSPQHIFSEDEESEDKPSKPPASDLAGC